MNILNGNGVLGSTVVNSACTVSVDECFDVQWHDSEFCVSLSVHLLLDFCWKTCLFLTFWHCLM